MRQPQPLSVIRSLRGVYSRTPYERNVQMLLAGGSLGAAGYIAYVALAHRADLPMLFIVFIGIAALVLQSAVITLRLSDEYVFDGSSVACRGWRGIEKWRVPIASISAVEVVAQPAWAPTLAPTTWLLRTPGGTRGLVEYTSLAAAAKRNGSGA